MNEQNATPFRAWALVEIFGHERLAGEVSEQVIAGAGFIRVDVPEVDGQPAFTRLYGEKAIYSITPVSEDYARRAAAAMCVRPVNVYIPALPSITGPDGDSTGPNDDDDGDWEDPDDVGF